jgi:hypothetical protein
VESVTQTYPLEVPELGTNVPSNTPVELMTPDPRMVPVVGSVKFWGLILMEQVAHVAAKPPPVTVTVVPRAAELGLNFTKSVIVNTSLVSTVSDEVFTSNVRAELASLAFCMPADWRKVIVKVAPAAMPLSPALLPVPVSKSGTVMVTAFPDTVTAFAEIN